MSVIRQVRVVKEHGSFEIIIKVHSKLITSFIYFCVIVEIYWPLNCSTAADSHESVSPPPSPSSGASESAPTLVHIKQENMAPGTDMKEYYSALDFGLQESYLTNYEYSRKYFSRPLELPNDRFLDQTKTPDEEDDFMDLEKSEPNLPRELKLMKSGGIVAKAIIPAGTKYGPFNGKSEVSFLY